MIHSRIKEWMDRKKITYAMLQEMTGLSSQTIARLRGPMIRECKLSTLELIAEALEVKITDLYCEFPDLPTTHVSQYGLPDSPPPAENET